MAVIQLPGDMEGVSVVPCVICSTTQPLKDVAVCLQGEFVCNIHLRQSSLLIQALAQYLPKLRLPPLVEHASTKHMGNVFVELRTYGEDPSLARDLARHLLLRQLPGKAIVLTDKPVARLSAVRKQWRQMLLSVIRERASTLKPELIRDIDHMRDYLDRIHMTIKRPRKSVDNEVSYMPPSPGLSIPKDCHTLYVTVPLDDTAFNALVAKMPDHAVVVRYEETKRTPSGSMWRNYSSPHSS